MLAYFPETLCSIQTYDKILADSNCDELLRSSRSQKFFKIGVLKKFANFRWKGLQLFLKTQTPTQMFSGEICEIFKNTFFHRTPTVAASGCCNVTLKRANSFDKSTTGDFRKNCVLL